MNLFHVSIIISINDNDFYSFKCLESIVNQSLKNIEIIIINNSTNSLNELVNLFGNKFDFIKIIDNINSKEIDYNLGINESNGQFLYFINSNEYIDIDLLEKLYHFANNNQLDVVLSPNSTKSGLVNDFSEELYDSFDNLNDYYGKILTNIDFFELMTKVNFKNYNKLYSFSFLKENNIHFSNTLFYEETFFFDVFSKVRRVSILNEVLYCHKTKNIFVSNLLKDYSGIMDSIGLIYEKCMESGIWNEFKINISNYFIKLIFHYFYQTQNEFKSIFFDLLKNFLINLFQDKDILIHIDDDYKNIVNNVLNSKNYLEFSKINNKIFSVVIPCYNVENFLEETLESVINQSFDFINNVEIILVDDGSKDDTSKICKKYSNLYPLNVVFLSKKNQGQAIARNLGLKYVSGKYINFLDADDTLKKGTFSCVYDFFELHFDEIDFVAIPIYFFDRQSGNHILNYKFKKDGIINLRSFWDYPQLSASSAFFKKELFEKYEFDTTLISSEDSVMINKILLDKMAYGVIKNGGYNYRKRFDESSTIDKSLLNKKFYNHRLKNYFIELIDYYKSNLGYVPKFIQFLIIYDIQWVLMSEHIDDLLNYYEIMEFKKYLKYILSNVEDEVIKFKFKKDPYKIKNYIFKLKYGGYSFITEKNNILIYAGDVFIDSLNYHNVYIDIIEISNNLLSISGVFSSYFNKKDLSFNIIKKSLNSEEVYSADYINYSNRKGSEIYESALSFDVKVPLNDFNSIIQIQVSPNINKNIKIILPIKFNNFARLSETCNYAIWEDYIIHWKNDYLEISKYSYSKFLKSEVNVISKILSKKGPYWTSAICFHFIYMILYIIYKNKKIWIFMDRKDIADDNAEHLYAYISEFDTNTDNYFAILPDSKDFNRLKSSMKNVIPFYSIKHRLLYLFADKIISSHVDEEIVNPFWGKNIKYYSGLITSDKVFLQHGVAKDDMSSWLRKYDKNVKLLVTTANIEFESFNKFNYNYDEGVVQLLGLPRYDNLSNNDNNKQILIMPSWRRSLLNCDDDQILSSEYYLRFNSLINNEEFINLAKSKGYTIIFKPHPNTFEFIHLFEKNDFVKIDYDSRYQDLFNNSSILITDYSSLSFDFGYIKKPVLYYQYAEDYHFDNNFFDYKNMGFGEVVIDENELISIISEYLDNNCEMKEIYKKHAHDFYKFNDRNNCKRVYDAISKIK